jgi:hypothetical protein
MGQAARENVRVAGVGVRRQQGSLVEKQLASPPTRRRDRVVRRESARGAGQGDAVGSVDEATAVAERHVMLVRRFVPIRAERGMPCLQQARVVNVDDEGVLRAARGRQGGNDAEDTRA